MNKTQTEIVVLGAGPGGYAAAFYAAQLGKKVIMVDKGPRLGGVCLNRGCIPSKALLHATEAISVANESEKHGISFSKAKIDLKKMMSWKNEIIGKLSKGIASVAKQKKVEVIYGRGFFEDAKTLRVESGDGQQFISFDQAIIATGSLPAIPSAFDLGNPRIMTSTEALDVDDVPESLLVVGGGYIGMELGTVYAKLGSEIVLVEAMDHILNGADPDLARPVKAFAKEHFKEVRTSTKVLKMATAKKKIEVTFEIDGKKVTELYDKVLISVGRTPNTDNLGLKNAGIETDDKGFIRTDEMKATNVNGIYAIGDVIGGMMLAHKASRDAKVAVDAIVQGFGDMTKVVIPAVVFTDPEVAWCGLTEEEAKSGNINHKVAKFHWGASGRAMTLDRANGLTKLIIDPQTERILGGGISGPAAGDMISEIVFAIEMQATIRDLALTVHPHPTLSESIMEAAENYLGHAVHAV